MKLRILAVLLSVLAEPALAQWQVPNHATPVGRGTGITGFRSVGPCDVGIPIIGAGASADPVCGNPAQTNLVMYYASDYGAVCNGVVDDTTFLANAITAANTTGGTVQLPGKGAICTTTASLAPSNGVIIQGAGIAGASPGITTTKFGTTIKWTGATGGSVIKFVDSAVAMGVRNLRIDGNQLTPSAPGGTIGVHVQSNTNAFIQDVSVENIGFCFYWKGTVAGVARSSGAGGTYGRLNCMNTYTAFYFDGGTSGVEAAVTDFDIFGFYVNNFYNSAFQFISNLDDIKMYGGYIQQQQTGAIGIDLNPNSVADNISPTGISFIGLTYSDVAATTFIRCNSTGNSQSGAVVVKAVFAGGSGSQTITRGTGCILNAEIQNVGYSEFGTIVGTTTKDGIVIQNPGLATVGSQQVSPRLRLTGAGWKTDATAASQVADVTLYNSPVQGAASPTPNLIFGYQVNGGGFSNMGNMTPNAFNHAIGYQIAGTATSANYLRGNGTAFVSAALAAADLTGTTLPSSIVTSSIATLGDLNNTNMLSAATLSWNNDLLIGRRGAAQFRIGAADAASPVQQMLTVQGVVAGTSNTSGQDFRIAGSVSTGNANGGGLNFEVSPAGGSGSSQNALVTKMRLGGNGGLGHGTETNPQFANGVTISSNTQTGLSPLALSTTSLLLAQADTVQTVLLMASWNVNNGNLFSFFNAAGTAASPSDTPTARTIGVFGWSGRGNSALIQNAARISATTTEAWTTTNGIKIEVDTTPTGSATRAVAATFQASGGLSVGTTTDPGIGAISANTYMQVGSTTVGSLKTCNAGARGSRIIVTDSNAASYTAGIGAVVAAGGATVVPVTCDGTNWRIG